MGIGSPFERAYTATYPFRTQIALPLTLYSGCERREKARVNATKNNSGQRAVVAPLDSGLR